MATQPSKKEIIAIIRRVDGIGPKLSDAIWKRYGNQTAERLISDHETVAKEISGISLKRAVAARAMLLAEARRQGSTFNQPAELPPTIETATVGLQETSDDAHSESVEVVPELLDKDEVRSELKRRWDETFQQRRHAESVLQRRYQWLLDQPNVTGAHVGFRRRRDGHGHERISSELEVCIRVHVKRKLPANSPAFSDYRIALEIPAQIEDVPTDVTERSYVTLDLPDLDDIAAPVTTNQDGFEEILVGGIEIAQVGAPLNGGTLGGVVFASFQPRLITNQHVAGRVTSKINQPASGNVPPGFVPEIGAVIDSEMPAAGGTGSIDCAIIALTPGGRRSRRMIKGLEPPFRFGSAKLTQPDVHRTTAIKVGTETGRTEGIVKSVSTIVDVNGAKMPNQIIVESEDGSEMIRGGDSGALLLVKAFDGSVFNVVGLVHARSHDNRALVATHFDEIENRFGVKVSPSR